MNKTFTKYNLMPLSGKTAFICSFVYFVYTEYPQDIL